MKPELEAQLKSYVNFPSPPGVASQIIELAQDPNIDMGKVAKVVGVDPALATKVLRIANSAVYAQRRRSESLRQALVVLGLNATLTLALSFSVVKSLKGGKPVGLNYPHFWRRTLLSATAARALGEATGQTLAEELFLSGLLQDIGMIALDRSVKDLYRDAASRQTDHGAMCEIERSRLGVDHSEVGAWLMRQWNLPERLWSAIERSHVLESHRVIDADDAFNRCVALSGPLADIFFGDRESNADAIQTLAHQVERIFGLDAEGFGRVLERIGALIGAGIGGIWGIEETAIKLHEQGVRKISPFYIPSTIINMVPGQLSLMTGIKGPTFSAVSACATANHSIGMAMRMIQYGDADVMVAGGAESTVSPLGIGGFASARALSTRNDSPETASRPWDKDRDGFVLGEGAGVLVLEEYEHAKKRGAKIYAELTGFGMGADAYHMTAPNVDGPKRSMRAALRNAGIDAAQVQYLNAHGTSTPLGDVNETNAIKLAFGDHAKKLVVNSTKSMTGHLLGGAGGIESVFTVLALHHQVSPPTINIFNQDPECDLDYCANEARQMKIDVAVKNNFGFGGTNGTLVFRRA